MKTIATFLLAFVFILTTYSQDDQQLSKSEIKKLRKEQKKAEQETEREKKVELTNAMITRQQFVLEAEYLSNKYGSRVPVQSTINFIMVDSLEGTIQFGSAMTIGYNGVGGATIEGRISNYNYTLIGKKNNGFMVSFTFMSSLGTYNITLMVNADGYADASVRGNWSGNLNYHGKLVPLQLSRIYKAHSFY